MSGKKRSIVLVILSFIAGMVYLTPFLRFTFYDQMLEALSITDVQLGVIGGVYGTFNVLSYIPSGMLAERFNTKLLLIVSMIGMCLTTVWYAFYPGYTALIVIHALYGVFSVGTFWSPYIKSIRQLGTESEQGRVFGMSEGLRGVCQTVVAFACLGLLGLFATNRAGFRAMLWVNAAVFAILMLAVIFIVPDFDKELAAGVGGSDAEQGEKGVIVSMIKMLKSQSTWICIFVIACGYALWNTANGFIGTYCTRVLNISPGLSSTLSIIRSYVIVFVAGLSGGFIIDRFRTKGKGMLTVFALTGVVTIGMFLTQDLTFVIVCVCFTVAFSYMVNVIKSTYWSILGDAGIPVEATGIATGVISLIGLTPDIFVPPIVSRFIDYGESIGDVQVGFNMMLAWILVWALLGIVASIILKKKREKALNG